MVLHTGTILIGYMDNKLIQQLQEEDLFAGPDEQELTHRKATKPPVVLEGEELRDVLIRTIATMIIDVAVDVVMDNIVSGEPIVKKPLMQMTTQELLKEALGWSEAYKAGSAFGSATRSLNKEKTLLAMIADYSGDTYDQIKF